MLLLIGPPGSGKTHYVLNQFRESACHGTTDVRLLTPTATMAEHLRNELTREGLFLRPKCIQTLHQFVELPAAGSPLDDLMRTPADHENVPARAPSRGDSSYSHERKRVSPALLQFCVAKALEETAPAAFAGVLSFPGFQRAVAELAGELTLAGCTAERLAALSRRGALTAEFSEAILGVFFRLEQVLDERGLLLRADCLRKATERIGTDGAGEVRHVLLDGFFTFSELELELIRALAKQTQVTVTLPEWDGAERARASLVAAGFREQRCPRVRTKPPTAWFTAPSLDQETEEIARRVLSAAAGGRAFREMGIVVRGFSPYVPVLRATLARFGIPARFYFAKPLAEHPAVHRIGLVIEAALSGWEHEKLLPAMLMSSPTASLDRFEFALRERLPGMGLDALGETRDTGPPGKWLAALRRLDAWRDTKAPPRQWASRFVGLRDAFPPPEIRDGTTHEQAAIWRDYAAALHTFKAVMEALPDLFNDAGPVSLSTFWKQAAAALRFNSLRLRDRRRNVVHVMDAYEARQWELPVVFVCGLLEKEFPRHHAENPLLPDAARQRLRLSGINLRTSRDQDLEERFLFQLATTRATDQLVLSYPKYNAAGEENLPSFLLQEFLEKENPVPEKARAVRPASHRAPAPSHRPVIHDQALRGKLDPRAGRLSPTAIETFLQCPFQFFAERVLNLRQRPVAPDERLDPLVQGSIVHRVIAEWSLRKQSLEPLFGRVFEEECAENRIPPGYRTQSVRLEMLESLRRVLDDEDMKPRGKTQTEKRFEIAIANDVRVAGRIDRVDVDNLGRGRVIDYKYSRPDRLPDYIRENEAGQRVQAGLYLLAARKVLHCEPVEMQFCAFRRDVKWRGWSEPIDLDRLRELVSRLTLATARRIRDGEIEPAPADSDKCEWCPYGDVCRVETAAPAVRAGGGAQ